MGVRAIYGVRRSCLKVVEQEVTNEDNYGQRTIPYHASGGLKLFRMATFKGKTLVTWLYDRMYASFGPLASEPQAQKTSKARLKGIV